MNDRMIYYENLKALGKCVNHPNRDAIFGRVSCQDCLDRSNVISTIHHTDSMIHGKCPIHPSQNVVSGMFRCQGCLDWQRNYRRVLKNSGKCYGHPHTDVVPGNTRCKECVEYSRVRHIAIQEKKFGVSYPTWWLCDICNKPIALFKGEIMLDHDHITGLFRHWLCEICNTAEGQIRKYIKNGTFDKLLELAKK